MDAPVAIFGPYRMTVVASHAVITRTDGLPPEPTWYELQHLKCLAWGSHARAVEIFPAQTHLYDTRNKRHLWCVPDSIVLPCLLEGREEFSVK
jgi:hypothetical protein